VISPEEPTIGKCDACDVETNAGSPRPWACSDSCYCELVGIDKVTGA